MLPFTPLDLPRSLQRFLRCWLSQCPNTTVAGPHGSRVGDSYGEMYGDHVVKLLLRDCEHCWCQFSQLVQLILKPHTCSLVQQGEYCAKPLWSNIYHTSRLWRCGDAMILRFLVWILLWITWDGWSHHFFLERCMEWCLDAGLSMLTLFSMFDWFKTAMSLYFSFLTAQFYPASWGINLDAFVSLVSHQW